MNGPKSSAGLVLRHWLAYLQNDAESMQRLQHKHAAVLEELFSAGDVKVIN